ncbi:hypothetical protein ACIRVK_18165 [Streptomyces sp. NPDC101152]|uniref:hypothetical protein n=1 Tax=Streptomyces sp. NPDC101152 TaxID=3366116 RepID=UPI0037F694C7
MNTERPDNDTAGSAEERGDGEERNAPGAETPPGAETDGGAPEDVQETGRASGDPEVPAADGDSDGDGDGDAEGTSAEAETAVEEGAAAEADTDAQDAESPRAEEAAEVPGPHESGDAPHPRRRRSPLLIASVAAAVFLVGGGGAYLATSASGGSGGTAPGASGDGGTPPPLALDDYGSGSGGSKGIAPGEPNPYGMKYAADGSLPDGPGSAPVFRVTGGVTEEQVARLAKALGLTGTPVARGEAWQVGASGDGSGPSLVVNRQAPGNWTFHRYAAGTDDCHKVTVCTKDPADPAFDPVTEAAAKKAAAPVLKAVGQDDAKVDASQVMGAQRVVNADPVVGGLPTYGWTIGLTVGAQGQVIGGSGQLSAPVKGDTYPVLGAKKTLDLLNASPGADHRMGIGGCATPEPLKDRLEAPCGQGTSAASPTSAAQALPVEKAVFGLASHSVGGRPALVPSWLFEVRRAADTFTVTYPAIDPKYLVPSSPSATPTPPGTGAPATRDIKVDGYRADGRELTVTFTGGVCGDYAAKASESSDKVTVTVTETPWKGKVCIMIAKELSKTVQLAQPLGDRTVVGSDGRQIPQVKPGALLPGTSAGVR